MKKIIGCALSILLISGCASSSAAASTAPASASSTATPAASATPGTLSAVAETQRTTILKQAVQAYNTVLDETFGATFDATKAYYPVYATEADSNSATAAPIAVILASGVTSDAKGAITAGDYKGKYLSPSLASWYPVTNYKTLDAVKADLSKYLDSSLYETSIAADFASYDGTLYAVRGGRGYGAYQLDISTLEFDMVTGSGNSWLIDQVGVENGAKPENVRLVFASKNNTWILTEVNSENAG